MLEFSARPSRRMVGEGAASLRTAPTAALYHLNAKFTRHYPVVSGPDAASAKEPSLLAFLGGHPVLPLGPGAEPPGVGVGEVIAARRSTRTFSGAEITWAEMSSLLRLGAGSTCDEGPEPTGRAVPSGGARYPVQVVVCAFRVAGIPSGIYAYDGARSRLVTLLDDAEATETVRGACLYPEIVENAAVVFHLVGDLARSTAKYGERGYRLALQEAGHVAQNMLLVATAFGLGSIPVAGFDEHDVEALLGLDGECHTLLTSVVVGRRPEGGGAAAMGGADC